MLYHCYAASTILVTVQGPPSNYAYFTACLQRNLRVAISLDPGNEAFSRRLEQNPALLSCCSMLWWQGWSESSLRAMAQARLKVRGGCGAATSYSCIRLTQLTNACRAEFDLPGTAQFHPANWLASCH